MMFRRFLDGFVMFFSAFLRSSSFAPRLSAFSLGYSSCLFLKRVVESSLSCSSLAAMVW